MSADAARSLQMEVSGELARGNDRLAVQRAERASVKKADQDALLTLGKALSVYVDEKRRGQLPLKDRTRSDYLAMIQPGKTTASGRPTADGELWTLAQKPLSDISAQDIKSLFVSLEKRGTRRATYAMQVLRAVLNWNGVAVPGNPLGKEVAGRERVRLKQSIGTPNPIPPERLGAWWRAACAIQNRDAAACLRFRLLTGARTVEVLGDQHGNEPIRVRDVDVQAARIILIDTKNRRSHTLLLSKQALQIARERITGKPRAAELFDVVDTRKTLKAINVVAGVTNTGHALRATFASIADELCSAYTVKRMLNHADSGDVTGAHYISKSEAQLRAGWQAVADYIEHAALTP